MLRECFSKMLLSDNPFRITPTRRPTIWAGREELKEKLNTIFRHSLMVSPSRLIINFGDWGTGKTHAGRYYSHKANIERIIKELKVEAPLCIFITLPRPLRAGRAIIDLYESVLENITFEKLFNGIRKVFREMNDFYIEKEGLTEEGALRKTKRGFVEITESEDLAEIFIRLASTTQPKERVLLKKYLWGQESATERTELGVATSIDSLSAVLRVIGAIFRILTFYGEPVPKPAYSEVFLWIDELEALLDLKAGDTVLILTLLRDIMDYTPNNLTLILNVTMKGAEVRDIESLLGPSVFERKKDIVEFTEFLKGELAIDFVKELINDEEFRPKKFREKCPNEFYPFTAGALSVIVERTPDLTPRKLNDNCSSVLEMACHRGKIKEVGDTIDAEFVREVLPA